MSDVAIAVKGLGKKYRLGARSGRYKTLRESLTHAARTPQRLATRLVGLAGEQQSRRGEEFWALKDVDFEVQHGEILGIIGHNGAGKSTLLKLLSRITEPTTGEIRINGRVASLLEVGTGFHPELTGRENVFLNGAILGMSRSEIARKFDEIVSFAEVEKFVDTQVKHYSSGMYLRLAFSVAAHLEPEILIVDEVLAVGDVAFQKKSMGKIRDVSGTGRTVLLVSHNMSAISSLCTECIVLDHGHVVLRGAPRYAIAHYTTIGLGNEGGSSYRITERRGKGDVQVTNLELRDAAGNPTAALVSGTDCLMVLHYTATSLTRLNNCRIAIILTDGTEDYRFVCSTEQSVLEAVTLVPSGTITCLIPRFPLSAGTFYVSPYFEVNGDLQDWVLPGLEISVIDGDFFPGARQYPIGHAGRGVLVAHRWSFQHA